MGQPILLDCHLAVAGDPTRVYYFQPLTLSFMSSIALLRRHDERSHSDGH
jgi:hypothetical protein